ncbi:MAG: hypothetical protein KatS3mg015_0314 [Fimbriimonadales bacterium]|nr:MAG: hypothetical protein KatS3mg015_0314 [Fimbriimonadales bacterium]
MAMLKNLNRNRITRKRLMRKLDFRLTSCAYPGCRRTGRVRLWTEDGRAVAFCKVHALYVAEPADDGHNRRLGPFDL